MTMNSRTRAAAVLLTATTLCAKAEAAVVLDQSTFTANGGSAGLVANFPKYIAGRYTLTQTELETVTAGVGGTLSELDLKMSLSSGTGDYQVVLFDHGQTNQTAYDYTGVVYTAHLQTTSTTGQIVKIDLSSADFKVIPGQVFSFSIRPDGSSNDSVAVTYAVTYAPYAGGGNYVSGNSGLPYDAAYREVAQFQTFVDTGAPEPPIWAIMTLGLGAVGARMRRRRMGASGQWRPATDRP